MINLGHESISGAKCSKSNHYGMLKNICSVVAVHNVYTHMQLCLCPSAWLDQS